jgi:hypothetical protein
MVNGASAAGAATLIPIHPTAGGQGMSALQVRPASKDTVRPSAALIRTSRIVTTPAQIPDMMPSTAGRAGMSVPPDRTVRWAPVRPVAMPGRSPACRSRTEFFLNVLTYPRTGTTAEDASTRAVQMSFAQVVPAANARQEPVSAMGVVWTSTQVPITAVAVVVPA